MGQLVKFCVNSIFTFHKHINCTNQMWTDLSECESHDNNMLCLHLH